MPEGPSTAILKKEVQQFTGDKIISVTGNSKIDESRLLNQTVISFKSCGKHFLICFEGFTICICFLLFGTYSINKKKYLPVHLNLMNEKWNPKNAKTKLKDIPNKMVCNVLLEQHIFSGVVNKIKNGILYRLYIHPESVIGKFLALEFLAGKKNHERRKHWLVHAKKVLAMQPANHK